MRAHARAPRCQVIRGRVRYHPGVFPQLSLPTLVRASLLTLVPGLLAGLSAPVLAQEAAPAELGPGIAARGEGVVLTFAEFDALAQHRHTMTETGRASLQHLLRARVLERLAEESQLVVGPDRVEARRAQVERDVKASGQAGSLDDYLRANHVSPAVFREFLRLGMIHEELARRALGIPEGQPVNGEQQEMWLDQIIEQRGTDLPLPPWDGPRAVVGRCGDVEVRLDEFLPHLRTQISREDVQADCYQLMMLKQLAGRLPDLSAEARERGIEAELVRRRAVFAADPKHHGVPFDQVMTAKGLPPERLRQDPAVVIGSLAQLWLDHTHGEQGMRDAYKAERDWFDGRFGESIEVSVIFLRASVMRNDLNPRTFEDAELELARLAEEITTKAEFEALARTRSEDGSSREGGGALGWLTRSAGGAPEALVGTAFANPGSGLNGPLRIGPGVVLAWIGDQRPAPEWSVMREHVSNELRRRFLEAALPKDSVVTWMQVE